MTILEASLCEFQSPPTQWLILKLFLFKNYMHRNWQPSRHDCSKSRCIVEFSWQKLDCWLTFHRWTHSSSFRKLQIGRLHFLNDLRMVRLLSAELLAFGTSVASRLRRASRLRGELTGRQPHRFWMSSNLTAHWQAALEDSLSSKTPP